MDTISKFTSKSIRGMPICQHPHQLQRAEQYYLLEISIQAMMGIQLFVHDRWETGRSVSSSYTEDLLAIIPLCVQMLEKHTKAEANLSFTELYSRHSKYNSTYSCSAIVQPARAYVLMRSGFFWDTETPGLEAQCFIVKSFTNSQLISSFKKVHAPT